ncbi:RecB family nuclease, putative, TM0106 family [Friedmanniella luteola]|uniref:RecB family nuclease, putative, TM0106 family n=1 Tax=Friedmanniella luteola TaxID=546871 RepID=A0A1H1Z9Y1_9ACTN|nr:TM0106 family RecB-like putative nuclease [Friedmanniella luteola]SDT30480.1 RecB family nuclease, putative, TM0106 family [Friedmanniella luteola]
MIEVRSEAAPGPRTRTLLLGASAARSCPVKTHNAFDATVPAPPDGPAELPARVQAARTFEAQQLEALIEAVPGLVVDLRLLDLDAAAQACRQALEVGAQVVVGGPLPVDAAGHRLGRPDLLIRGADAPDGRPTYHPGVVKAHKVLLPAKRRPPAEDSAGSPAEDAEPLGPAVRWSPLASPRPLDLQPWDGVGPRLGSREGDFLQLAHYHRMLEAAGYAGTGALGAVLGTDTLRDGPVLAWVDLAAPVVRTFSRSAEQGWRLRSLLERYDHELGLRVDVARTAARRTGDPATDPEPLVRPVVQRECQTCRWWPHCRAELPDDEISLRVDKGALDVREVLALRRRGVRTVPQLATADLDALLPGYLPEVSHRTGTENRLRVASRRARMLHAGVSFDRETSGPILVPAAALEVDLDIESAADGRIYLWGFLLHDTTSPEPPRYVAFSRFTALDDEAEATLADEAFHWLRGLVEGSRGVRVYHYSAYEPSAIKALAAREPGHAALAWAAGYADELVDLYDVVKAHFFGAGGLGLKPIAQHAGFRWRDEDPGGLNSQAWFADAVSGPDDRVREQARVRVLEYNEDDVRATAALRAWLRSR